MIIYDFCCNAGHRFEGWFSSPAESDRQIAAGELACPHCESAQVSRVPSAANVHTRGAGAATSVQTASATTQGGPGEMAPADRTQLAEVTERLRRWVASVEDVGGQFANEARRIHQQDAPDRAIRGVTTPDEASALREEGISVLSLPAHLVKKLH